MRSGGPILRRSVLPYSSMISSSSLFLRWREIRQYRVLMEVEPGMLRVRVPREAVRLLGASDTLAVLYLWGLQNPPLRSELHFTRSWAETDKSYLIEHDDGMVVLETCVPWMKVVFTSGVRLAVVPHPIEQGEAAAVRVETDEPMRVRLTLVDARGGHAVVGDDPMPPGQRRCRFQPACRAASISCVWNMSVARSWGFCHLWLCGSANCVCHGLIGWSRMKHSQKAL